MPISTRDEMRRAVTGGRYRAARSERDIFMSRMSARMNGGRAPRSVSPQGGGAPEALSTGRTMPPAELAAKNRASYGLGSPAPDLNQGMTGDNWPAGVPRPGTRTQPARTPAAARPAPVTSPAVVAAPGMGPVATGTSSIRTRRANYAEALGNAGIQTPLPPPRDLKPFWADPANATIANAATPGKEGFVRSGDVGYSDRPDIVAWKNANRNAPKGPDGMNIVERFEEQQRRKGLLAGQTPDYSGSFGTTPQYSPEDAFNAKFDLPEFASVNSEDVKQWPQQAMAPEQITEAFQGRMDLDPRDMPNEPFRAPLRSSYQDTFSAEGLQGERLVAVPVTTQSVDRFPTQFSGATNTAAIAGFGGEADEPNIRFPADAPAVATAFNGGLDLGVSYADPDGNRNEAFNAGQFLARRKNGLVAALFGR